MNLFFPMETTVAVIKPDAYEKENERGIYDVHSCLKRFRIYSELQLNKPKFLGYAILWEPERFSLHNTRSEGQKGSLDSVCDIQREKMPDYIQKSLVNIFKN